MSKSVQFAIVTVLDSLCRFYAQKLQTAHVPFKKTCGVCGRNASGNNVIPRHARALLMRNLLEQQLCVAQARTYWPFLTFQLLRRMRCSVSPMRSFIRCLHTTPEFKVGTNPIELLQKLHKRGLVKDNSAGFSDHLLRKRTVNAGFDPTAETLHIGSLSLLTTMCMFAKQGHEVIALIGGATALVGDPSGRSTGRKQLSVQQVEENSKGIAEVIKRVVGRYSSSVRIVNNADWMSKISLLDFLRSTGNHFRVDSAFASVFAWKQFRDLQVGALLSRDSVKNRMTSGDGLSFTEMSYQLMQAHDFAFLHKEFGCTVQLGGADQWGNIVGGIELVRKVQNAEVHALTIPLILNSSGEKLGKSAGNAVWLRQDMTSLYSFRSVV